MFDGSITGPEAFVRLRDPEVYRNKVEGWQDWLARYGILEGASSEDAAYERYLMFRGVTFPMVPESRWHVYFRDLVLLE